MAPERVPAAPVSAPTYLDRCERCGFIETSEEVCACLDETGERVVRRYFDGTSSTAVLAALLAEDPEGTARAIEKLLTSEEAVTAAARALDDDARSKLNRAAFPPYNVYKPMTRLAFSAACAALGTKNNDGRAA